MLCLSVQNYKSRNLFIIKNSGETSIFVIKCGKTYLFKADKTSFKKTISLSNLIFEYVNLAKFEL